MSFWIGKKKRKKVLNIMNCNTLYEKNLRKQIIGYTKKLRFYCNDIIYKLIIFTK